VGAVAYFMIPLERIKSTPAGDLFIYEAPGQPGVFYSGRVIMQPVGVTEPKYLRLIPTDKRLPMHKFSSRLVRELAYNHGVAFHVSEENLRGDKDISEDLRAQARGTDLATELAVDSLLKQLPEVRRNFVSF
jgi:hypothetical protein